MQKRGYKLYIAESLAQMPYDIPIYTEELAFDLVNHFHIGLDQAKSLVNVNLPRLTKEYNLRRYKKGIYYKAKITPFGPSLLNPNIIHRDRYLQQGDMIIGYLTGAAFINRMGLSTQIPKYRNYATNKYKYKGHKVDEKMKIKIQKPKTEITNENYQYLQLLDMFENKDGIPFDVSDPEKRIYQYIDKTNLDFMKLIGFARKHYSKKTQEQVMNIAAVRV